MRVGVISDTHGVLRPEAIQALRGSARVLHAGDVGSPEVLATLEVEIAPVIAVRGNNDHGAWAEALPEHVTVTIGGVRIHVIHERAELAIDPVAERVKLVVTGHSHRASVEEIDGVSYLNPGGSGRRRFSLPLTVATLEIAGRRVRDIRVHTLLAR